METIITTTRCTRGVRVVFSVARMRSSNSARMKKLDFTTEKIGSVHMTVFEIVVDRNVDNWTKYWSYILYYRDLWVKIYKLIRFPQ